MSTQVDLQNVHSVEWVVTAKGNLLHLMCVVGETRLLLFVLTNDDSQKEMALRRLVACANACVGMPANIIAQAEVGALFNALIEAHDGLTDASECVDKGDDEEYAYQNPIETLEDYLGLPHRDDEDDDNAPELYDVDLETDTAETLKAIEQGDEAIRKAILWAFIRKSELSQILSVSGSPHLVFLLPGEARLVMLKTEEMSQFYCTLYATVDRALHLDGYSDKGEAGVGETPQEAFDDFMLCFARMCKDLPARYGWSSLMVLDQKVEAA